MSRRGPAETVEDVIPRILVEEAFAYTLQREIDITRLGSQSADFASGRIDGIRWALERFEEGRW